MKGCGDVLKRFEVTNYKNFKKTLVVDFGKVGGYQFSTDCITNKTISKMFIFGRNATGKTNLGYAIFDITACLYDSPFSRKQDEYLLNADASEDFAEFAYTFQFGNDEINYRYRKFSNSNLKDEEMYLNGKRIFCCDFTAQKVVFLDLTDVYAETVLIDRYVESLAAADADEGESKKTLSFLRWLSTNTALPSSSPLLKLYNYVRRMRVAPANQLNTIRYSAASNKFFYDTLETEEALRDFEAFLNIMGVECELVCKKLPDGQNELYFKHKTLIPFSETASSGTMALTTLYRRLQTIKNSSFVYLDEFDAFYNYEMAENVVRFVKHTCPDCQVVFTTHNTNLMSNHLLRPDCVCILSRAGTLTPLNEATTRELREGHNLEKMFISGEFERYE